MVLAPERPLKRVRWSDTSFADTTRREVAVDDRVEVSSEELSGGIGNYDLAARARLHAWPESSSGDVVLVIPGEGGEIALLTAPENETWLLNEPIFEATGKALKEMILQLVSRLAEGVLDFEQLVPPVDVPTLLAEARNKVALPVQDLASLFGVKRRQFYNLLNGDDVPSMDTERRIGPVVAAIRALYDATDGDSRLARSAALAPIAGDSVFDAAAAADFARLEAATRRAVQALQSGEKLHVRPPRSHRPSPQAVEAARRELELSRDQMGLNPDA